MKNNLLFQILEKLPKKEFIQIKRFVSSPFFNTSDKLSMVLAYLINCIKKGKVPTKQLLFQEIFGSTATYDDHKVRLLLSDLLKVVEEYLVYQQIKGNKASRNVALSCYYRKVGLEKHFDRTYKKVVLQLEELPYRNQTYFSLKNKIEWEQYELKLSKKRGSIINLQELGQDFDIAYFSSRLRQACFLKAQQVILSMEYDFSWIEQIIEHLKEKKWLSIPAISLYYSAYQLYSSNKEADNFESLKRQILVHGSLFPPDEIRDIYLLAINYCIRKVNNNQKIYQQESLDLYKAGLASGCFLENGILSKFTYANIVAFGLMVQDFDWVANFIVQYKNSLKKEDRNSSFCFNMARLEYTSNKNYDAALEYLQKVNDKDVLNTLNSKVLQLRIYFEIKAFDLLGSHLEAMANFVRRKQVIGFHKENYTNIIKYTQKLLKLNPFDAHAHTQLAKDIGFEKVLSERDWLLGQLVDTAK